MIEQIYILLTRLRTTSSILLFVVGPGEYSINMRLVRKQTVFFNRQITYNIGILALTR
jgi:hypothetical protein